MEYDITKIVDILQKSKDGKIKNLKFSINLKNVTIRLYTDDQLVDFTYPKLNFIEDLFKYFGCEK